jgi:hypothetical protein
MFDIWRTFMRSILMFYDLYIQEFRIKIFEKLELIIFQFFF